MVVVVAQHVVDDVLSNVRQVLNMSSLSSQTERATRDLRKAKSSRSQAAI